MNTNTIYFVRHTDSLGKELNIGDSIDPRYDGLSSEGKRQAIELANTLAENSYDIIFSSPLLRCRETLAPYLEKHRHDVKYDDRLIERDAGIFIGRPRGSMKKFCEENGIIDQARFRPENGKSLEDVLARARSFYKEEIEPLQNKKILICGHRMGLLCLELAMHNLDIEDLDEITPLIEGEVRHVSLSNEAYKNRDR